MKTSILRKRIVLILKILTAVFYCIIPLQSVHFGAPLILMLLVVLFSSIIGAIIGIIIISCLLYLVVFPFIYNNRRDKLFVPIASILLLGSLSQEIYKLSQHYKWGDYSETLDGIKLFVLAVVILNTALIIDRSIDNQAIKL